MFDDFKKLKGEWKIILYIVKSTRELSKYYISLTIFNSVVKTIIPLSNIILPKYIIDELIYGYDIKDIIVLIGIIISINLLMGQISAICDFKLSVKSLKISNSFDVHICQKIMQLEYEKLENPDILNLKEKAIFPIKNQGAINRIVSGISNLLTQFLIVVSLGITLFRYSPLTIITLSIASILILIIMKKSCDYQYEFYQNLVPIQREYVYFSNLACDFQFGKEVRLYNLHPLIMNKIRGYNNKSLGLLEKAYNGVGKVEGKSAAVNSFHLGIIYLLAVLGTLNGEISVGTFTMFINAAINITTQINGALSTIIDMRQMAQYLESYVQFDKIEISNPISGEKFDKKNLVIEFDKVSFKYPNENAYALKDISVHIYPGEKISIVGKNGAGKTSFIKLLLGLYKPTSGKILVNGINIDSIDSREYQNLFSVIFQDFKLFATSIEENIIFGDKVNSEKLVDLLAGLGFDTETLKNGIKTQVFKIFDSEGIEFSGGESQKIAIARSIHKNSKIIILDEPTAALDPISEKDIYINFDKLTQKRTSIFISHRLSSCKLSDRILVFENGKIVQEGSHSELLEDKENLYYQMFSTQAQNYM